MEFFFLNIENCRTFLFLKIIENFNNFYKHRKKFKIKTLKTKYFRNF